MLYAFEDRIPTCLGNHYFIAASAEVIGSVIIHNNVMVLPHAVVRGDNDVIEIGENTNIQDGVIIHTDPGFPMKIRKNVAIGHNAVCHGQRIGDYSVISIGATILANVIIGKNCMIGAQALVLENQEIPDNSLVIGVGKVKSTLTPDQVENLKKYSLHYLEKITRYKKGLKILFWPMSRIRAVVSSRTESLQSSQRGKCNEGNAKKIKYGFYVIEQTTLHLA